MMFKSISSPRSTAELPGLVDVLSPRKQSIFGLPRALAGGTDVALALRLLELPRARSEGHWVRWRASSSTAPKSCLVLHGTFRRALNCTWL